MWFELGLRLQQEAMGNSRGYSRRKNEHGPRHRGWKKQGPSPSSAVVPTVLYKSVQGKSRDWPDLTWVVRTEPKTVVPLQSTCYWVQAHTACHMCVCLVTQLCPTVWTLWTIAHQASLSMGFSRQEYWSGLLLPSPEDLVSRRIEPASPVSLALWANTLPTEPSGKSSCHMTGQ